MIKRIAEWLTATLPPNFLKLVLVGAIFFWGLERSFYTLLQLEIGQLPDDFQQVSGPRVWLLCCLVGWATWRAYMINPIYQSRFRAWLETTPWNPGGQLPFGRIELASQDAVCLSAAMIAFWHWPGSLWVPLAFLLPFIAILTFANSVKKQYVAAGTAVGLLTMLPVLALAMQPLLALACVCAAAAASEWGWRSTLRDYPWELVPTSKFQIDVTKQQEADGSCAWWPLVHPWRGTQIAPLLNGRETLLLAGFCGWLAVNATMTINSMEEHDAVMQNRPVADVVHRALPLVAGGVGLIAALIRLYSYAIWCAWPISLHGRIKTGRFFIPGYDRVFIAPLMTLAAGLIIPRVLLLLGAPTAATAFVTMFVIVLAAAGMRPTLATWSLTGEYRLMLHTPVDKRRTRQVATN
ncbi:hypothetical protein [Lacipirellula limnantheis]|uniref:Uncharacterized protein n=1 Tax=Lacipirellula limnantheis TaxID=2528024 RepID=A0A517TRE2_9BACT|nr:hypothetical protein [Lacipirellula limnantheis]QDT70940.1 hypothetical protein I41_00940 [Lacipirellula limnantheis]